MRNLPNILTFSRILLIPLFVVLMILDCHFAAMIVFVVAAITDFFDGLIARRFGYVSDFGKLLDPLADKILVMTALVMLAAEHGNQNCNSWVPAWIVVIILGREIWVTGLRGVAAERGIIIPAGNAGKIKSFLQMLAVTFLLLNDQHLFNFYHYNVTFDYIGLRLLFISVFFSLSGAYDYTKVVMAKAIKLN